MKNIILISFITIFLISCGNSQRSAYISSCLAETPGGSSYEELCACAYDGGVALMSPAEKKAWERDFSEVEDAQYAYTAPLKMYQALPDCQKELLK
tara:strand:+ start:93 stop:380 length:288 start_codon:yes stop_codon:yes gene_type:complete